MTPLKLIALGATLFGLGMTLQQMALSWILYHSSDMLLVQIYRSDRAAEEALVRLDQEKNDLERSEVARAMEAIDEAFREKTIAASGDQAEAASGSLIGQRWMKWAASLGILLKVGGGLFWLLSFLKMMHLRAPSLPDQICGIAAASLLLMTILFDQTAASVTQEAVQQGQLQGSPGSRSVIPMPSSFGIP